MQFYNYLAAVEVQPQSVATPTHKFTRARYTLIGAAPLPGQAIDCPGQILQIRDCPGDSGTVGAYVTLELRLLLLDPHSFCHFCSSNQHHVVGVEHVMCAMLATRHAARLRYSITPPPFLNYARCPLCLKLCRHIVLRPIPDRDGQHIIQSLALMRSAITTHLAQHCSS